MVNPEVKSQFGDDPKLLAIIDYLAELQIRFGSAVQVLQRQGALAPNDFLDEYRKQSQRADEIRELTMQNLNQILNHRQVDWLKQLGFLSPDES